MKLSKHVLISIAVGLSVGTAAVLFYSTDENHDFTKVRCSTACDEKCQATHQPPRRKTAPCPTCGMG